jgi:hypothetical protein
MCETRNSWLLPRLPPIVFDAPRTIGRSGFLKADDGGKHTKDEQENPHCKLQNKYSQTQIAIQVFYSRISDGPPRQPRPGQRASRKKFGNHKKTGARSETYSFLIGHGHLLSSGCLSSLVRKTARVLGPGEFVRASFCARRVVPNSNAPQVRERPALILFDDFFSPRIFHEASRRDFHG